MKIALRTGPVLVIVLWMALPAIGLIVSLGRATKEVTQLNLMTQIANIVGQATLRGLVVAGTAAVLAVVIGGLTLLNTRRREGPIESSIIRLLAVAAQFFSPLLIALGWLVLVGSTRLAFSALLLVLALTGAALPVAIVLLDSYAVQTVWRYLDTAALLGAGPKDRAGLALKLAAPALVASVLVALSWGYSDLVIVGMLSSGESFYPGTLVAYLFRQSTLSQVALISVFPSIFLAVGSAFILMRLRRAE